MCGGYSRERIIQCPPYKRRKVRGGGGVAGVCGGCSRERIIQCPPYKRREVRVCGGAVAGG